MGIEDRDRFREKKLHYDGGDSYKAKKITPRLFWSLVWVLISFSYLGIRVYPLLFPNPHQQTLQAQEAIKNPPLPSDTLYPSPPIPPKSIHSPAPPMTPAEGQPQSAVLSSSAESQTLHYYKKNQSGIKYLTAEINNIPFEVMLDTGASYITLGSDAVQRLGISSFNKKIKTSTGGGFLDAYLFECASVKIGTMTIDNVTCLYVPNINFNLLGNSFLSHFIYSVNEADETITLIPKDNKTYISDNRIMPVEGSGWAEINGKKYRYENGRLKEIQDK